MIDGVIRLRFQSDADWSQKISYASCDSYADTISLKWNWYECAFQEYEKIATIGQLCF